MLTALAEKVPAMLAESASPRVSQRYQFISSVEIVTLMTEAGFNLTHARQQRSRKRELEFSKHIMRFRPDTPVIIDGTVPEIVVTNAHDTSAGFGMFGGLYRFICLNGMVIGNDLFRMRVPHMGNAKEIVTQTLKTMTQEVFPNIQEKVKKWMDIQLQETDKIRLAVKAIELRHMQTTARYGPERLLEVRRLDDKGDSLWSVFNVVQENILRGGVETVSPFSDRRVTSKPISAIDADIRINRGLWDEAEKLAEELA